MAVLSIARQVSAGLFGGSTATATGTTTSSSTASPSPNSASAEVAFLQSLQAAQITSMSCLITLVNMTANPIGSCLGLTSLTQLIVDPNSSNGNATGFADSLSSYLSNTCAVSQCSDRDITEAQTQLSQECAGSQGTQLIMVLNTILNNYSSSYRTLACSMH
jgi:hypothetical protein